MTKGQKIKLKEYSSFNILHYQDLMITHSSTKDIQICLTDPMKNTNKLSC